MRARSTLLGAAVGLCLAPAAALAQQQAFEGFYVGGFGSYTNYDIDLSVAGVGSRSFEAGGYGYGAMLGVGLRWDMFYGGIEGEIGIDGADKRSGVAGTPTRVESELSYGVKLRAGAVLAERAMPYLHVGWQRTEFEAAAAGVGSDSASLDGLRAGAGLEFLIFEHLSARAEYSYTMYDEYDDLPGVSADPEQHLFRVGLAFYF